MSFFLQARLSCSRAVLSTLCIVLAFGCSEPPARAESLAEASTNVMTADTSPKVRGWKLPKGLREVSGLARLDDGSYAAVADEKAAVYQLDPQSGRVLSEFAVGKPVLKGDFEGVAWHAGWLYLLTSDGVLVRTKGASSGATASYETFALAINCELEGLASDPQMPRLWLVCKRFENASLSSQFVRLYAWSVTDQRLMAKQPLELPIAQVLSATGLKKFMPSGITFVEDAGTQQLVLIAGRQNAWARWRWDRQDSKFLSAAGLPAYHRQAEGIALAPDGGVLIADEGGKKRGRLRWYEVGELF